MGFFKKFTIANRGLRYKLMIAFSLMSIIPLLACTYVISNFLFPQVDNLFMISSIIIASIVIAVLGLFLAKGLVDPVIDMAIEANIIANGHYDKTLVAREGDEIGDLALSINSMTQKIKTNLDELKGYGQKMREINVDVHRKVLALSSLLQIGDMISSGSIQLDSLLELAVEKASMLFDSGFGIVYMKQDEGEDCIAKVSYGLDKEKLENLVIRGGGRDILGKSLEDHSILVIDKGTKASKEIDDLRSFYNFTNVIGLPLYSGRRNFGMLVVGSRADDLKYKTEDIDLVKVFAKQVIIAIESDILNRKTEELAIKDDLTDLYNKNYIMTRLGEEIKRAIFYQRPCSFVIFNIDNFKDFSLKYGELASEEALSRIARLIRDNLTPVAKAARISGDEFAILLPEKNKREASGVAEEIRKKIEVLGLSRTIEAKLTVSAGVSENPLDGTTAEELLKKAMDMLKEAKTTGKNKVMV